MQLIQELTLVQKAGVFIGIPLILLFVLIAARRRRAAAGGVDAAAATSQSKRGRSKKDSGIPRRKRRKLAAEAAQAIGTPAPAAQPAVAEPPAPAVEPGAFAESAPAPPAPEAVAAPAPAPPPVPVVPAPADDPYVQEITFDEEQVAAFAEDALPEVVVAAPGWPTPGELASSFDPDAFDPLPSAEPSPPAPEPVEDVYDEVMIDEEPEQPTEIIEMPAVHAGAYAEHDEHEVAEWDGDFDPATGWGEDEVPVPVAVAAESEEWYDSDATVGGGGGSSVDQPNPVDLDQFWSHADIEESWADSSEVEILSDLVDDASVPDWVHDDSPAAWEPDSTDEAPAAPQSTPDGWTIAAPTHGSPVVLDLAGLAASGHALELVIESSGDGRGVRLRFESPSTPQSRVAAVEAAPAFVDPVEVGEPNADEAEGLVADLEPQAEMGLETSLAFETDVEAEDEAELPATEMEVPADAVAAPVVEDFDVPFLTGGLPTAGDAKIVTSAWQASVAMPAPEPAEVEIHDLPVEEAQAEDAVHQPEPLPEATTAPGIPDVELTEDPATILAEIRARLAALDGRS